MRSPRARERKRLRRCCFSSRASAMRTPECLAGPTTGNGTSISRVRRRPLVARSAQPDPCLRHAEASRKRRYAEGVPRLSGACDPAAAVGRDAAGSTIVAVLEPSRGRSHLRWRARSGRTDTPRSTAQALAAEGSRDLRQARVAEPRREREGSTRARDDPRRRGGGHDRGGRDDHPPGLGSVRVTSSTLLPSGSSTNAP